MQLRSSPIFVHAKFSKYEQIIHLYTGLSVQANLIRLLLFKMNTSCVNSNKSEKNLEKGIRICIPLIPKDVWPDPTAVRACSI